VPTRSTVLELLHENYRLFKSVSGISAVIRVARRKEPGGEALQILGIAILVVSNMDANEDLLKDGHGILRLLSVTGDTLRPSIANVEQPSGESLPTACASGCST
jgi:hypothetical protein